MKKKVSLLFLSFLFIVPISGQVEHATTPEQCRADADAWNVPRAGLLTPTRVEVQELQQLAISVARDKTVTAKILDARSAEFAECEKTDTVHQSGRYAQAIRVYAIAKLARMADFMQRHNLTAQFYQEDDQGQR